MTTADLKAMDFLEGHSSFIIIYLFIYLFSYSFINLFIYSLTTYLFIYLFIYLFHINLNYMKTLLMEFVIM